MRGRKSFKLDELGTVVRGRSRHRPRNDPALYGGNYPFFQTGDITQCEFYLHNYSATYNEQGLSQSKLWPPGTLCITIAANIAETAILSIPGCFPDSVVGFTADPIKSDARFIKYYIDVIKNNMRDASRGTTQDNLSVDKLLRFDFTAPSVVEQTKIADVLGVYENLIENNTRRIAILEEMARRIFEEWFVHCRAPGCEGVPLVESELGPIPKGWSVQRLDSVIDFDPTVRLPDGDNAFVPMTSLSTSSMIVGEIERRSARSGAKFMNGDTLFARITPCLENGKTGFVDFLDDGAAGVGSTEFVVMRGRTVPATFVQLLARSNGFRATAIKSMSGATGRQRVRRESLEQFEIAVPPVAVLRAFDEAARLMFKAVRAFADQSVNLRAQRDLLLPKLISGEIEVADAAPMLEAAE